MLLTNFPQIFINVYHPPFFKVLIWQENSKTIGLTSSLNLNLQLKFEEQNLKINIYKNGICLKTIKMFIYHLTTFCVMIFKRKSNL